MSNAVAQITREQALPREADAAWIIALWKMIHGGDPSPEEVAARAIAALSPYLGTPATTITFKELEHKMKKLGIHVSEEQITAQADGLGAGHPARRRLCHRFADSIICIEVPPLEQ
jgi:hypothetical protein